MQRMSVRPGAYPHHITSAGAAQASHACVALSDPACDDGIHQPPREGPASLILPMPSYRFSIQMQHEFQ